MLYFLINNNNSIYVNSNSLVHVNKSIFKFLFVNIENKKKKIFTEFYKLYNVQYLQSIYNIRLKEKNINAVNILPTKIKKFVLYTTRKKSYKRFNIKYFNEVVYLFLVNIYLKNSKNICKYIKKKLESVHFKKHRKYFLFFFKIIRRYVKPNFTLLKIDGILIRFKGKLGRGGNSRTKTMFFRIGKTSQGDKCLALNTNLFSVWTKTGSFSCLFQIFYK